MSEPEHEIRIRMLGNSEIFVTCKCLDKVRSGWRGKTMKHRLKGKHHVRRTAEWKSLGDFPVGTPTPVLIEAWKAHLDA